MLLELHCHTTRYSSCSQLDPKDAVLGAWRKGLQGLVITEHQHLWSDDELAELRQQAQLDEGFVLLAGQEVDTDIGHVLVFGAARSIPERTALADLRAAFPDAALIWAHPFRSEREPRTERLLHPLLDAVEIFNSNHSAKGNYLALSAWHRHKFIAVGGSDAHAQGVVGMCPTQLDHPIQTLPELVTELRAGRCRPFFKEIPKAGSNIVVTEITIGTKGEDEARQRIVVKRHKGARRWRRQAPALAALAALYERGFAGGTFRVPRLLEVNEPAQLVIEEGQRGKSLYDLLGTVSDPVGQTYHELAARWLGRMHALRLQTSDLEQTLRRERRRRRSYQRAFASTGSPYLARAEALLELLGRVEARLLAPDRLDALVQCHGDYHPKNIIIGQDRAQDIATVFVSVIDFANTILAPPALDVGYFLAQFRHQLRAHPRLQQRLGRAVFLQAYRAAAGATAAQAADFEAQVTFFELRANLSIAAFLIKVGQGESAEMEGLMARLDALARQVRASALAPAGPAGPAGPVTA